MHLLGTAPPIPVNPRTLRGAVTVKPPVAFSQKANVFSCPSAPAAKVKLVMLPVSVIRLDRVAAENVGVAEKPTVSVLATVVAPPAEHDPPLTVVVDTESTRPFPSRVSTGIAVELPNVPGLELTVAKFVVVDPAELVTSPPKAGMRPPGMMPDVKFDALSAAAKAAATPEAS
jgi:hypothetical protein